MNRLQFVIATGIYLFFFKQFETNSSCSLCCSYCGTFFRLPLFNSPRKKLNQNQNYNHNARTRTRTHINTNTMNKLHLPCMAVFGMYGLVITSSISNITCYHKWLPFLVSSLLLLLSSSSSVGCCSDNTNSASCSSLIFSK